MELTPRAKKVLVLAECEAKDLEHCHIDTGHLLLALLCEPEGHASDALIELGVKIEDVRTLLSKRWNHGPAPAPVPTLWEWKA